MSDPIEGMTAAVLLTLLLTACSAEGPSTAVSRFAYVDPVPSSRDPGEPSGSPTEPDPASPLESRTAPTVDLTALAPVNLVVDQFGYLPEAQKIAVLRDPRVGFDRAPGFRPAARYHLVDVASEERRLSVAPEAWNGGATDPGSGDRVWWLDFSELRAVGEYRIEDDSGASVSESFAVRADVYEDLLVQALRTFVYQRAGFAKEAPYADPRWADGASHLGPGQDGEARRYDTPDDASSERDLSGGWYDAGDFNRYTSWAADYVIELLHAWRENPAVWSDDFGLPESGNGIPDLVDEILWGLAWLERMQEPDGGLLSVLDVAEASPPSSASGPSRYGPATTAASFAGAAAFAFAASSFADSAHPALADAAERLLARAEAAWRWAEDNPNVVFRNNDPAAGTVGVGAGQQEPDERGRARLRLSAAIYLTEATRDEMYRGHVSASLPATLLIGSRYASPFDFAAQRDILFHAAHERRDPFEIERIHTAYVEATGDQRFWSAAGGRRNAYLSYLDEYVWGSNGFRAKKGLMYLQLLRYGLGERDPESIRQSALDHLHYLHGVNPLGLVYLSNMGEFGASRSIGTVYHNWFADGSELWDSVERSRHGPLPGLLVGGPNPTYRADGCCPDDCGSAVLNARCEVVTGAPFVGQPTQKAFAAFNEPLPLNSWQMTENSNGYQVAYLRLLAWFVSRSSDQGDD